jgi:exonuclease VII large subunit
VIAARNSDAMTDVVKALRERWPSVQIVARTALVEGVRAVDSVIDALGHLQAIDGVDVIILARGGGGVRDLVAFDDERLCRAVFACAVPVVTSIGHTAHRPNCDHLAADYADVPARAAELVVPSIVELTAELDRHRVVLENVPCLLRSVAEGLADLSARARPDQGLERRGLQLDGLDNRLEQAAFSFYSSRERAVDHLRHRVARVRSDVPGPSIVDLCAQQLHASAASFFAEREHELNVRVRELSAARMEVPAPQDIIALAARLEPAYRRARRKCEDYRRAFARMREQASRTFTRRIGERDREVAEIAARLSTGVRRVLSEARQALGHALELIDAKDFRRSGWVLAADAAGRPARSVGKLAVGEALHLHFHDGVADAAVTNIHPQQGEVHG